MDTAAGAVVYAKPQNFSDLPVSADRGLPKLRRPQTRIDKLELLRQLLFGEGSAWWNGGEEARIEKNKGLLSHSVETQRALRDRDRDTAIESSHTCSEYRL